MLTNIRKLRELLDAREQWLAVVLLGMMMFGAILEMVGVGAIPAFVALLSDPSRASRYAVLGSLLARFPSVTNSELALWGALVLLVIFVCKNSYLALVSVVQARYVTNRQIKIATRLFHTYLESPYVIHLRRNSAELLRNATNEAMDVVGAVLMPGLTLTMELLTIAAILTLLIFVEPVVSIAAFALLGGATAVFIRLVRARLARHGHEVQYYRMKMFQTVNEGLGSLKVAKVLGRERHFLKSFGIQASRFAEANRFRQVMMDVPRLYLETAAMIGLLGVAALMVAEHRPTQTIIPTLSLLAVAVVRMIPSFNRITSSLTTIRYGKLALDAVHADLMSLEHLAEPEATAVAPIEYREVLSLEQVTYIYPGAARPSLQSISLQIRRGSAIGIVGPTGSGKSTLIDVILGLLKPTEGRILVDGAELGHRSKAWQRHIGYVPQDIFLMDDSIRRNIAFGISDQEIDQSALNDAINAAQLTAFIASLPEGAETEVGERGIRLSGGQRQRIGIARALYNNPDILVLDEATSSLDNETERFVMQAVDHLRGSRTIILVAHRMSTVRGCDELFLLSEGRLVASGPFEELVDESSRFRALVEAK